MSKDSPPVEKKATIDDILKSVGELNKQQINEIYVPSLKESVSFKTLTVKQQKQLLSSGVDVEIENLTFSNTINSIIMENCLAGPDRIKLTDRAIIVYQLRCNIIGDELKFIDDEIEYTINLKDHLEQILNSEIDPPGDFEVEHQGLTITGTVPGLIKDTRYNKQFTNTIKNNKSPQGIKLTDIVGDIYIHEMVKYVTSIKTQDQTLDLDENISITQAIQIFESLPMTVSSKIANEIKKCRELEMITITNPELPDDVQLPFDASLFTSE